MTVIYLELMDDSSDHFFRMFVFEITAMVSKFKTYLLYYINN